MSPSSRSPDAELAVQSIIRLDDVSADTLLNPSSAMRDALLSANLVARVGRPIGTLGTLHALALRCFLDACFVPKGPSPSDDWRLKASRASSLCRFLVEIGAPCIAEFRGERVETYAASQFVLDDWQPHSGDVVDDLFQHYVKRGAVRLGAPLEWPGPPVLGKCFLDAAISLGNVPAAAAAIDAGAAFDFMFDGLGRAIGFAEYFDAAAPSYRDRGKDSLVMAALMRRRLIELAVTDAPGQITVPSARRRGL